MPIRTSIIIRNLEDLKRFRRELEAIVALDGKTVNIRFSQRGFATGSMLPRFPTFAEAQKLIAAHHSEIALSMPFMRKEAVRELKRTSQETFMPLSHAPGEAQMDFGEALVKMDGELRKVMFFAMVLSNSGAMFVRAYPRECTETFQDGHVQAFRYYEGVPTRISYDNAKTNIFIRIFAVDSYAVFASTATRLPTNKIGV